MIGSYLEQSVKLFVAQQREMRERGKELRGGIDPTAVAGLAQPQLSALALGAG